MIVKRRLVTFYEPTATTFWAWVRQLFRKRSFQKVVPYVDDTDWAAFVASIPKDMAWGFYELPPAVVEDETE